MNLIELIQSGTLISFLTASKEDKDLASAKRRAATAQADAMKAIVDREAVLVSQLSSLSDAAGSGNIFQEVEAINRYAAIQEDLELARAIYKERFGVDAPTTIEPAGE